MGMEVSIVVMLCVGAPSSLKVLYVLHGIQVQMLPDVGPHFPHPIKSVSEAVALANKTYDVKNSLSYMYRAITLTRHLLEGQVPLIGFSGAPWTLFAYMVEGGGSKTFSKAKEFLFSHPEESRALLNKIGEITAEFLVYQIQAGAQLVQIFDSWAGELSQHDFHDFEMPVLVRMLEIIRKSEPDTPVTVFAKGANYAIPDLAKAGFNTIGLDWNVSPSEARRLAGDRPVCLQGNLDPGMLLEDNATLDAAVKEMFLGEYGFLSCSDGIKYGHIANLGHGITPNVHPESMKCELGVWFGTSLYQGQCTNRIMTFYLLQASYKRFTSIPSALRAFHNNVGNSVMYSCVSILDLESESIDCDSLRFIQLRAPNPLRSLSRRIDSLEQLRLISLGVNDADETAAKISYRLLEFQHRTDTQWY
jgi:uroporphyrinogen decarboxylase